MISFVHKLIGSSAGTLGSSLQRGGDGAEIFCVTTLFRHQNQFGLVPKTLSVDGNMSRAASGALLLCRLLSPLPLLLLLLHAPPGSPSAPHRHPLRFSGTLAENSPAGTPVDGLLLPLGAGGCPGADLNASLSGDYASDFRLVRLGGPDRSHLGLVSSRVLDREFIAMYQLTVQLPPRCHRRAAAVQVEVSDRNDNIPRIDGGNQTVEVDALTPLGTEVARFDAKDADAERNGRVTFYASPESDLLHVVPRTGQVRLLGSLLAVGRFSLRLYAADGGDVALISEPVFLHVIVRRSNRARRRPRALSEELSYSVAVPERVTVGELLFTVPDQRFEQRRFEVMSEAESPVRIERDSGRLYLTRSLREPAEVLVKIRDLRGKKALVAPVRKGAERESVLQSISAEPPAVLK